MLALIFANGEPATPPELPDLLDRAGLIVAVDGGANHCARLGIVPNILIGDLDSIKDGVLQKLQAHGIAIHRHPPEKDATDLELAFDLALDHGATSVRLLSALGGRWDMSMANIMLCALDKYRTLRITLEGSDCRMHILHPGTTTVHPIHSGRKVSLLPLKGDVHGITLEGFRYPLQNASLAFGSSRGISNTVTDKAGTVRLRQGVLLCICLGNE